MRYINLAVLIATLFGSSLIYAADPPATVGRSETTLEREGRLLAEQKAADQQRFYVQIVVAGAVAIIAVIVAWILLARRVAAGARRLVELKPLDALSKRRLHSDLLVAEPVAPSTFITSNRNTLSDILIPAPVAPSTVIEPELNPVPMADSVSGTSSSYEMQYILVRSADDPTRQRLARIYVLSEELVVIDNAEGGQVHELIFSGGGPSASESGTSEVTDVRAANDEAMQRLYGRYYDPLAPLEWSKAGGDFRARFKDLFDVSIDPLIASSGSKSGSRAVGTLRFRHRDNREFSYEILSLVEVHGAIRLLTRALGNALNVSKDWDEIIPSYLSSL